MPHVAIDEVATRGTLAKTRPNGFALLPRADYVSASFSYAGDKNAFPWSCHCGRCPRQPVSFPGATDDFAWTTQLMLAHGDKPDGINYLILRDTVDIAKASTWTFPAIQGALDCFVVSPAAAGNAGAFHLKLPGAGVYYVALIPRSSGAIKRAAPGDGKVIRLSGAFGTDYCFLGRPAGDKATCGDAAFEGTAGAVQDRASGLMLHLSAPGSVRYKEYGLSGATPAALRVAAEALTLSFTEPWPAGEVVLQAPGKWTLEKTSTAQMKMNAKKQMVLTVPAGVKTIRLTRAR